MGNEIPNSAGRVCPMSLQKAGVATQSSETNIFLEEMSE